jgi:hypothetical protein
MILFEHIEVDLATGNVTYPELPGFELNEERMVRMTKHFLPFCDGDLVMAMKHAIHGQLTAHYGMMNLKGDKE